MWSPWTPAALAATFAGALAGQEPGQPATTPPATGSTTTSADVPAPLPDGAPPQMAQIDRVDLKKHAYWLADDARQGRFTSSKSQFEVANYIAQQFQKLGLKPLGDKKGYLQLYPLDKTFIDTAATSLLFGSDKITANYAVLPASDGDKVLLGGHFAFCGNGSPDQLAKGGLKGRIPVVAVSKAPRGAAGSPVADNSAMGRCAAIAKKLAAEGASAAVICVLDDQSPFANALNYQALLPEHPLLKFHGEGRRAAESAIPLLFLGKAQSLKLLTAMGIQFDDDGKPTGGNDKLTGKLQITVKNDPKANACNVVAWLEGKGRKNEAVVFSAHMDHIGVRLDGDVFNGADDDASGTSGLLEVAEAFAKGDKPARSIVFLSVSGEELGLWGSSFFADNPTWPKDLIV
ncbi:MAG TPA: M28 family peptidase, partial [Planctomycetota bacterium]|nr:M28 family peptidase [Planctomycetota bacterium]